MFYANGYMAVNCTATATAASTLNIKMKTVGSLNLQKMRKSSCWKDVPSENANDFPAINRLAHMNIYALNARRGNYCYYCCSLRGTFKKHATGRQRTWP